MARRFVRERPDWGAVLIDLREHGESLGRPPPHTIESAARDVRELEDALSLPLGAALGHSFGGKVALQWMAERERPSEVWLIDSCPSARTDRSESSMTAAVLGALQTLSDRWDSRDAFVKEIVESGQPEAIAKWLAMNLRSNEDGSSRFGPDLDVIRALLDDYDKRDLWALLESPPSGGVVHAVIGGRSAVYSPSDRERVRSIERRTDGVFVHLFEESGHWVHIDAPGALLDLLTSAAGQQR
jgi:pimeloyl-ACP methyl ester carboxylesterase